jgi:hypothetical protein
MKCRIFEFANELDPVLRKCYPLAVVVLLTLSLVFLLLLPIASQKQLAEDTIIMTKDNPIYMY